MVAPSKSSSLRFELSSYSRTGPIYILPSAVLFRSFLHDLAVHGHHRIPLQRLLHPAEELLPLPDQVELDLLADTRLHLRFDLLSGHDTH